MDVQAERDSAGTGVDMQVMPIGIRIDRLQTDKGTFSQFAGHFWKGLIIDPGWLNLTRFDVGQDFAHLG